MIIHIIRHAQAIERSPSIPDEHRALTCRGRKRFRKVAAAFKKLEFEPTLFFASPKIRAVQTADILAEALRSTGELLIAPVLGDRFTEAGLHDILHAYQDADELVFIGHEPDLGDLVAGMLGLDGTCSLSKGCVVSLSIRVTASGIVAQPLKMITGSGTVIHGRTKILERLQGAGRKQQGDMHL